MSFDALLLKVREESTPISADSREVRPGHVFVAVPGVNDDGARYIPAAVQAGAKVIVCRDVSMQSAVAANAGVQVVFHPSPREALWRLAAARYNTAERCSRGLRVVGITGTNGKTTTAYMLEHLFETLGHKVGTLGTVNYRWPGHVEPAPLTTPDSVAVHRMLAAMNDVGVDVAVMEVSSHALTQQRVGGVPFAGAVFTNLTQDHLDFHENMDNYFRAKAVLFEDLPLPGKAMAINADDIYGRRLLESCPTAVGYGLTAAMQEHGPALRGSIVSMSTAGLHLQMRYGEEEWELRSPLVGAFNASNLMAVQALALGMGVPPAHLRRLEGFCGVRGRLERMPNPDNLHIFVDYAHTPDALTNALEALRGAGFAQVITVFGCGGNRDRSKRPLMGQAVGHLSTVAVLTSDNPRFESPEAIITDVLPGLRAVSREDAADGESRMPLEILVEPDRRTATALAVQLLHTPRFKGAALLIAGKGHEDYQIIDGVKHPYSDQQVVRELLQCV